MKKYLKRVSIIITGLGIYLCSIYLNESKSISQEEAISFIATCGAIIQGDFRTIQRDELDYFIVLVSVIVVLWTLFYSIKYLLIPEENSIKLEILKKNEDEKIS